MKAIVTRANPDGTFDSVGMNNIYIERGKMNRICANARMYAKGRPAVRIEWYPDGNIYKEPESTTHILFAEINK